MKNIKHKFVPPPPARKFKKEAEYVETYLDSLVLAFLLYCQELGAVNFSPKASEHDKVHNFRMGIVPGDQREKKLAERFILLNYKWKRFCHKKFLYHKMNLGAFEEGVAKNIKQLSPGYIEPKVNMLAEGEMPPRMKEGENGGTIEMVKR